jgi:predicted transcriptional regulator
MEDEIISLTAQIASAHASYNDALTEHLPGLIRDVHKALSAVSPLSYEGR